LRIGLNPSGLSDDSSRHYSPRYSCSGFIQSSGTGRYFHFHRVSPLANSVVVEPDDPYIVPSNNQHITIAPLANFRIKLYLPLLDNQGSLQDMETFIVAVFTKLAASSLNYNIGSVSGVSVDTTAGDLLTRKYV
jgi:hypothetical protein